MAGLVQYLSAKLGLVTGRSLPEAVADHTRRPTRIAYWLQAELVAMATDLAEVVGGAIALHLLFDLPLLVGGVITGAVSLLLLLVQDRRGQRAFERVITGLLLVIAIGLPHQPVRRASPARSGRRRSGAALRRRGERAAGNGDARCDASCRTPSICTPAWYATGTARPASLRARRLAVEGHPLGRRPGDAVGRRGEHGDAPGGRHQPAGQRRTPTPSRAPTPRSGTRWARRSHCCSRSGLLASGLASTSVGAYAGAMIMQGLLRRSYPLLLRRVVTLIPALVILAVGVDPSRALVLSQVVLSFGIPFALIPLVRLTSNRALMGEDTNHRLTTALGWLVVAVITVLKRGADLSDRDGLSVVRVISTSRTGPTCACSRWRGAAPTPSIRATRSCPTTTG